MGMMIPMIPEMRTIMIVDDDADIRETLADYLAGEHGFTLSLAETLDEADTVINAKDGCVDAVILDVDLPDGDGRDFCAKLRRLGHVMPVIMLTGRNAEVDTVCGLDSGANDYVAKPFRLNELLARLRAQWRIFDSGEHAAYQLGPYTFRPFKKLLHDPINNRHIPLNSKEVGILKFLFHSDAPSTTRQTILQEVWGYNAAAITSTLETHVYRLRQKMEPDPKRPTLLVTVDGGYRLDLSTGVASGFSTQ
jgi:DNA-binding response OmpR family regulator